MVEDAPGEKITQPDAKHGMSSMCQNFTESDQEQMKGLKAVKSMTKPKTVYPKEYTKQAIETLIRCITEDKMSVEMASKTVNMSRGKALEFYKTYVADPEHKIPKPVQAPKSQYKVLEVLDDEHIRFIKDFCQKNKGVHERIPQKAFHAQFPETRVVQRLLLPHMGKTKRAKKITKRSFVRKINADHTEFITGLYVKEPGISFAQVHRLLLKQFPDLSISKPGLQIHIHRHLKDVLTGSVTRSNPDHTDHTDHNNHHNHPEYSSHPTKYHHLGSKKLDSRHIDFIVNLYDERPKMPFTDLYKELAATYPTLCITPLGLRIYLRSYHKDLYRTNNPIYHKLNSKHTTFLKDLYERNPDTKLKQAQKELMDAFPGLSVVKSTVSYHLKHKCGI